VVEQLMERKAGDTDISQRIFSPLSNQPTNRYLKEIMKDLKINKTMTFHRARHTFRTIAAKKGIRDSIAERIMGHAEGNDIKDIYTHLHDEDIVKEMFDKWVV
jgi:Phage integrase family.